jgi:hypothetical protein
MMKAKTLVACAITASALPLASAWAAIPTGPQGTDLGIVTPVVIPTFAELDVNRDGVISREEYRIVPAAKPGSMPGAGPLVGPSWATNPPAPAR